MLFVKVIAAVDRSGSLRGGVRFEIRQRGNLPDF
jgi:hypothetical protein